LALIFFCIYHGLFVFFLEIENLHTHSKKLHRRCDNIAQDIKEKTTTTNKRFPIYTGSLLFFLNEEKNNNNNNNNMDLSNISVYEFILRVCRINNNGYKKKRNLLMFFI
jgi:hypothetical protein